MNEISIRTEWKYIKEGISPLPTVAIVDGTVLAILCTSPSWSEELDLLREVSDLLCPLLLQAEN